MAKLNKIFLFVIFSFRLIFEFSAQESNSQLKHDSIWSNYLNEYRAITVYLPSNYSKNIKYPTIYATDGQFINHKYKQALDSLINEELIAPVLLVGVHSNNKLIENSNLTYRSLEYISSEVFTFDSVLFKRYENHMRFFSEEMIKYVESKYNAENSSDKRVFYGYSNGAGFGISLSLSTNHIIDNYVCLSTVGYQIPDSLELDKLKPTSYFVSYGSSEPQGFINSSLKLISDLDKSNIFNVNLQIFDAEHSNKNWLEEFKTIIIKII